jgi:hypothetical protein
VIPLRHEGKESKLRTKGPPVFQKDLDLKDVGVKHNLQIFKNLEGPQEIKTELLL